MSFNLSGAGAFVCPFNFYLVNQMCRLCIQPLEGGTSGNKLSIIRSI